MYSLSISFGPAGTIWGLLYKTEEAANDAYTVAVPCGEGPDITKLDDDFGQRFAAPRCDIHGVMLEDLTESQIGMIERSLHNKRGEVKANQRAAADPAIKTAMMSRTPVYSPVS